ncbi:hypothetical protein U9M48_011747, partial [Paspalum notatum var. saurae]
MEGAVILYENLHELHKKKRNGVIFKIDFKKAYDKVKWDFLQQILRMKGFSPTWYRWIKSFVQGGNFGIKINDHQGLFFQARKGLRQGDFLSPILFNIVADMLAIILARAKDEDGGLSILQYADDAVIFMDHDLEEAMNMKLLVLKINFHKSKIFCFGQAKEVESSYSHLFGCKTKRLKRETSFHRGRLVLINSVLSSLPMFMMSFFEVPRGVLKKLDYYRSCFFRLNDQHKKKYRLARWEILANENGLWQCLLRNKYLRNKTLTQVEKNSGDSQFWSCLMGIKDQFLNLGSFILKIGTQIRGTSLKYQYPSLFNIVRKKHATVAEVLGSNPLSVSFRRSVVGNKFRDRENLVARLLNVSLEEGNNVLKWQLHKSGIFSVRSTYLHLVNTGIRVSMEIWRKRLPLKIKIFFMVPEKRDCKYARFLWNTIHTAFGIRPPQNIQHLFGRWMKHGRLKHESLLLTGAVGILWALWLSKNDTVLFRVTYWLQLWAKLQQSEECKHRLLQAYRKLET